MNITLRPYHTYPLLKLTQLLARKAAYHKHLQRLYESDRNPYGELYEKARSASYIDAAKIVYQFTLSSQSN